MSTLNIEVCPETGICSIIKGDGSKIDLMPDEVSRVREATGNAGAIQKALAEIDSSFAESLDSKELAQVSKELT
jgi:hypothetical protein